MKRYLRQQKHLFTNSLKYLFIFLCAFNIVAHSNAQTTDYSLTPFFVNYSTKNGLPSNETYSIAQDKKGYIWVGTDRGVARFDGQKFEVFTTEDGLLDNVVFNIQVDNDGKIWFFPWNGQIFYFEYGKGFKAFKYNKIVSKNNLKKPFNIRKIDKDSAGNYYLSDQREGRGFMKISPNGILERTNTEINSNELKYSFIKEKNLDIIVRKRNSFLSGSGSIKHFIGKTELSCFSNQKFDDYRSMLIPSYFEEEDSSYFITGKYMTKITKKDTIPIILKRGIYPTKVSGGYIVGYRLHSDRRYYDVYWQTSIDPSAEKQLLFKNVFKTKVIKDQHQGVWITSHDRGVFYIPDVSNLQNKTLGNLNGIIPHDHKIFLYNVKEKYFTLTQKPQLQIDTLLQNKLSYGHLSYQESIPQARKVYNRLNFLEKNKGFSKTLNHSVIGYQFDKKKHLSLLTSGYVFKINSERQIKTKDNLNRYPRIICFEKDDKDHLWLGKLDGLYCYLNDNWVKPTFKFGKIENRIQDIKFFKEKKLSFFATIGNGFYIVKDSLLVKHYTIKNGLLANSVNQLYIDATKKLWIATIAGFHYIDLNDDTLSLNNVLSNFAKLISPNIKQIYARDSLIYLGTDSGLNVIDWKKFNTDRVSTFPIYIDDFKVNQQSIPIDSLKKNPLSYRQNNIEVNFTALAYKNLEKISYRYKLFDLQDDWLEIPSTTIRLIDQKPSNYRIEIQAKNDFGTWISAKEKIEFTILEPYWQTFWFQTIAYLLVFAIGLSMYIVYARNKEKRKKQEEELNMNIQKLFSSQLNPHFVFNSLNSIQNFVLKNERMISSEYLGKFALLIRRIFENSSNALITFEKELETINTYIELEQLRFTQKFEYELTVDPLINKKTTYFPSNLLQPIVENAIKHGLVNKEGKGTLEISIKKQSDDLFITIKDDGVGRNLLANKNTNINKKTSKGLHLTRKRLQVLSKIKGRKTSIEIEDLISNDKKPLGTRVSILVPHLTKNNIPDESHYS